MKYIVLWVWALWALPLSAQPGAGWRAGVATGEITPPNTVWMAGYASRDHLPEKTLQPLYAKALALTDAQGKQAIFISTDLLGLPRNVSAPVCRRLGEALDLDRSQILLTSSHTHSGPVLRESLYDAYGLSADRVTEVEAYSRYLEDELVGLALKAAKKQKPARLFSSQGVCRFGVNRRNNSEVMVMESPDLEGPFDHSVPVIKVENAQGKVKALVFGYACHATVLNIHQWSGDYPGFAQQALEKQYPKATALFFAGCGGDINPLPRRSVHLARQYGQTLAASVIRVVEEGMEPLDPALQTAYTEIDLPFGALPALTELQDMVDDPETPVYFQRWAQRWIDVRQAGKAVPRSYPHYPIQSWRLGGQGLVALGGEVLVNYALRLKDEVDRNLFVAGYANDVMAYIPSEQVLDEGGYEGKTSMYIYGMPAVWAEGIEARILQAVKTQLASLD